MNKSLLSFVVVIAALCSACISGNTPNPREKVFDLGMMPSTPVGPVQLPALSISRVTAPEWLNGPQMYYRLLYANAQQPLSYSQHQWSMSPARLFEERIKSHISQNGGLVLASSVGIARLPSLRIELDDFTHVFESPERSYAQLTARVAVLDGRKLLGQKLFQQRIPAPSPDAEGGARAMAQANDMMMADILHWLSALPLQNR